MSSLKHLVSDTVDASFEMPEQYGSRGFWRYNQIKMWVGLVAIPILIGLNYLGADNFLGGASLIFGFAVIGIAATFFILRDRKVQKRLDRTGLPYAEREPY